MHGVGGKEMGKKNKKKFSSLKELYEAPVKGEMHE